MSAHNSGLIRVSQPIPNEKRYCHFCHRPSAEVRLLERCDKEVRICVECVKTCNEILKEG